MIPEKSSSSSGARASLAVIGVVHRERHVLRAEAPSLLLTVESAVAEVRAGHGDDLTLDRSACIVVPAGARVTLRTSSPASRVAVISFHEPLFASVARAYRKLGLDRERLARWLAKLSLLPRTVWVHEIVHRYVFERTVLHAQDNAATRFLEMEILKEVYFLFRDRDDGADRATALRRHSACVERAIAYVETHLFDACDVSAVASRAGASESTLLRAFRREVGCSPGAYGRNRKLDEALVLLRTGRYSVADIATRVGYDNPTAFGFAFRRRFGQPPTTFRPRRAIRAAP
jgi:AraC-like DNA-binding protein